MVKSQVVAARYCLVVLPSSEKKSMFILSHEEKRMRSSRQPDKDGIVFGHPLLV